MPGMTTAQPPTGLLLPSLAVIWNPCLIDGVFVNAIVTCWFVIGTNATGPVIANEAGPEFSA